MNERMKEGWTDGMCVEVQEQGGREQSKGGTRSMSCGRLRASGCACLCVCVRASVPACVPRCLRACLHASAQENATGGSHNATVMQMGKAPMHHEFHVCVDMPPTRCPTLAAAPSGGRGCELNWRHQHPHHYEHRPSHLHLQQHQKTII